MGGLHDYRDVEAGFAHPRQHAEPIEIGHDQVEHDAIDALGLVAGEQGGGGIAALRQQRPVAEAGHHGFQQPALHRIVVDDENGFGHGTPARCTDLVQCRRSRLMVC